MTLGPFPVDDATLGALEHALDATLTFTPDGEPVVVGAEYSLGRLLEWLSGPSEVLEDPETPLVTRVQPAYSTSDALRALIGEVRRLRRAFEAAGIAPEILQPGP